MADRETPVTHPAVSVVIAAYNAKPFIRRSIESVLAQTFRSYELIVIDDGSEDGTGEIVAREFGNRVKLITQTNGGVSSARNAGIRQAQGKYIAFLDADDWWDTFKLELQVRCMEENPDATAHYTGQTIVDAAGEELSRVPPIDQRTLWPLLRWCNPAIPPSSVMLRRAALAKLGASTKNCLPRKIGSYGSSYRSKEAS